MRTKLPMPPKAHKPADSGVVVGIAARRCGLSETVQKCPTPFTEAPAMASVAAHLFGELADAFAV